MTEYHQISSLNRAFQPYETLWDTTATWLKREEELYNGSFTDIDGEEKSLKKKSFYQLFKKLNENKRL